MEDHSKQRYCPERILELAERNQLVAGCLLLWRKGELTWDEALAYALVLLADHGDRLETLVSRLLERKDAAVRPGTGDSGVVRLGGEDSSFVQLGPDDVPTVEGGGTIKGAKTTKEGETRRARRTAKGGEK